MLVSDLKDLRIGIVPIKVLYAGTTKLWPPVFSPTRISGLGLWLDADKITAHADGDPVNTWYDSSGAARHAYAHFAAPTYRAAAVNGKPAVEFLGGSAQFRVPGWGTALTGSTQYTMFQVIQQRGNYGNYPVITTAPTSTLWEWITEFDAGGGVYFGSGNGRYRMFNRAVPLNTTNLLSYLQPAGSGPRFFLNSTEVVTYGLGPSGDSAPAVPNIGTEVALGSYYEGSYGVNGYIGEVLWYNRALSDADRVQVENYLRTKWGLP
jgi:hypothetical protein